MLDKIYFSILLFTGVAGGLGGFYINSLICENEANALKLQNVEAQRIAEQELSVIGAQWLEYENKMRVNETPVPKIYHENVAPLVAIGQLLEASVGRVNAEIADKPK